jgi:hypothetical protein
MEEMKILAKEMNPGPEIVREIGGGIRNRIGRVTVASFDRGICRGIGEKVFEADGGEWKGQRNSDRPKTWRHNQKTFVLLFEKGRLAPRGRKQSGFRRFGTYCPVFSTQLGFSEHFRFDGHVAGRTANLP